jgi:hypothetical protein
MFRRAILIEQSCDQFCQSQPETQKFLLTLNKWNLAKNIMTLLEPLSKAAKLLCGLKFPTLNNALPVYIILIKHLHIARRGLYDQAQLVNLAAQMIAKINGYLHNALTKPVYICAMILDPSFKAAFWKTHENFISKHYSISLNDILLTFCTISRPLWV